MIKKSLLRLFTSFLRYSSALRDNLLATKVKLYTVLEKINYRSISKEGRFRVFIKSKQIDIIYSIVGDGLFNVICNIYIRI